MNEQVGPKAILADLRENLPQLRSVLRELPTILKQIATLLDNAVSDSKRKPD
jgi:predicted component of type VI protein secretion system